jgi:hypothetical protein
MKKKTAWEMIFLLVLWILAAIFVCIAISERSSRHLEEWEGFRAPFTQPSPLNKG